MADATPPTHLPSIYAGEQSPGATSIARLSNSSVGVVRILAVEDFAPYREFVASLLNKQPNLRVVCEVSSGLEAVQKAQKLKPDLILMDIGLPDINGIEAARRIRKFAPESRIIFLTQESSSEVVQAAIELGACGYVLKSVAETDLLTAVEAAFQGKQFFSAGANGHGS